MAHIKCLGECYTYKTEMNHEMNSINYISLQTENKVCRVYVKCIETSKTNPRLSLVVLGKSYLHTKLGPILPG